MLALIAKENCNVPSQLKVVVQLEEETLIAMQMSPFTNPGGGTGKFHGVNVLGMDFLKDYNLSMLVDTPILHFKLVKRDMSLLRGEYSDDEEDWAPSVG